MCRQLQTLIDASIELQLRIELASDGFFLGHRGNMVATDLLKLVMDRREAFEQFLPQSFWIVPSSSAGVVNWEISDGVWARSPDQREGNKTFRGLVFEELLDPQTEGGRWSLSQKNTGIDIKDFSFWLDEDALFLVESLGDG